MKKALYIGGFCLPDGNAAAQRVLGVAKLLHECDCDVRFCGLAKNIKNYQEGSVEGFQYRNYAYPSSLMKWLKYLCGHDSSIAEIDSYKPDIVILYNHPALAIERIQKHCRKKNIKVIADITEWYEPVGNPFFKLIKKADVNRRMLVSHKRLDGMICISNYLTKYYNSTGLPILYLPPLIDIHQAKWHQPIVKNHDVVKLVYAGSPGSSKDRLDLIMKALDGIVPDLDKCIKFDIIGITQEQYKNTWNDDKVYSFANFHGRIPHLEVIKYLLEADFQIFLRPDTLPNRAGFPTKFVETITSSTLPITNLSSNLSDYLRDGVNGFVVESLEFKSIQNAFNYALKVACDGTIDNLQENIKRDLFDYRHYRNEMFGFLKLIIERE